MKWEICLGGNFIPLVVEDMVEGEQETFLASRERSLLETLWRLIM